MLIKKVWSLEQLIKNGMWQVNPEGKLFGGANLIISKQHSERTERIVRLGGVSVVSPHARAISQLIFELKDIFFDYLDSLNKYLFYLELGRAANRYLETNDEWEGVLLAILDQARQFAYAMEGKLYFAYGSNMDKEQMAYRCPTAKFVGKAKLEDYQFIINERGVAIIVNRDGSQVVGLLWTILGDDEASLDRYEGVKTNFYTKEEMFVSVEIEEGEIVAPSLVYVATNNQSGIPRDNYLERIVLAA